ncbi:9409_t:CDS:1 [Paraglomus occultum]|uniref:9409_t:CDS:1 n=1 Tax=Paraglomus occultum TaxID=144539 RepID=A0A9N8VLE4_9GLOM|nr:9409_t:CDS:1 [Paraglomus occultum]
MNQELFTTLTKRRFSSLGSMFLSAPHPLVESKKDENFMLQRVDSELGKFIPPTPNEITGREVWRDSLEEDNDYFSLVIDRLTSGGAPVTSGLGFLRLEDCNSVCEEVFDQYSSGHEKKHDNVAEDDCLFLEDLISPPSPLTSSSSSTSFDDSDGEEFSLNIEQVKGRSRNDLDYYMSQFINSKDTHIGQKTIPNIYEVNFGAFEVN